MDKPKKKERAKKLDQETLAKIFVGQSRSRGDYAQKKRMNVQEEYESYLEATGGNPAIASDMLLYNNAAFRAKFNRLPENRENVDLQVHYDLTANLAKDKRYFEDSERYEKRQLVTTSDPGGLNVIQTSLSDTIVVKSERLGQILQLVAKDEIPDGDKEYPTFENKAVGAFVDEITTPTTDQSTVYEDATKGLKKVKYTPRDFQLRMKYSQRILKKVTPRTLAFYRQIEAEGMTRGLEQQILRGDGTGQNATGVNSVATSVTFNGNAYLTFNDAVGVLAAADTENIAAVMHRKTWQEMKKLRVLNQAYRDAIKVDTPMIDDIPVIISNNNDASVATTGIVNIGDFRHYLVTQQGGLDTIEDKFTEAANRIVNIYHALQVDMGALLASSFATFSITF